MFSIQESSSGEGLQLMFQSRTFQIRLIIDIFSNKASLSPMAESVIQEGPSALPVEGEKHNEYDINLSDGKQWKYTIIWTEGKENEGMMEYKETKGLCEWDTLEPCLNGPRI